MTNSSKEPRAPFRDQEGDRAALIIIDMISRFAPGGDAEAIAPRALSAARAIRSLRDEVTRHCWPVIYVNDNFGEWHSERSRLVERAAEGGNAVVSEVMPAEDDFFIIKPQFSGFYATNLPVLLPKLGVSRLILTGIATDICVLFTAADAHMRDYTLWVPQDAVAAEDEDRGRWALEIMAHSMGAQTGRTDELTLDQWFHQLRKGGDRPFE
jgi:nicotinamidase-related amidase|tara:strand:- start:7939 stop:8571 length:633 start_codon:yes stop_codon:yes gene_type:complete